ncbi:hypothetical protein CDIK_2140 [Cucumispora dikerogammari]|nr:hypothetical protein CDIK_2140 [Cucumispora dikerogammari]
MLTNKCKKRLFYADNNRYIRETSHSHEPVTKKAQTLNMRYILKTLAIKSNERVTEIITLTTKTVDESIVKRISKKNLIIMITKVKNKQTLRFKANNCIFQII